MPAHNTRRQGQRYDHGIAAGQAAAGLVFTAMMRAVAAVMANSTVDGAGSLGSTGHMLHGLVDPLAAFDVLQEEPAPDDAVAADPEDGDPRMSRRVPSVRVPCQCHSAHPVSSWCAEQSSSAWKSGTPAKTSAQCSGPAGGRRMPGRDAPAARCGTRDRSRRRRRPGRGGSGRRGVAQAPQSPRPRLLGINLAMGLYDGPVELPVKAPAEPVPSLGPSWGRETAVTSGQPRCPTDNKPAARQP
jgi:hypothetical protein